MYYFRVVPSSYNEKVIREIGAMGHEVGYHYETKDSGNSQITNHKSQHFGFAQCKITNQSEDHIDRAYNEFCRNLEMFRKIVPVETICMHGSPRSKYDNKNIRKKYDYKKLGLTAEPYYDINFR
jgi:hypothetical protein